MVGGRGRDRTGDPLLAKQVLSQLSYTPTAELRLILKYLQSLENSETHFLALTVSELCQNPCRLNVAESRRYSSISSGPTSIRRRVAKALFKC